MEGASDRLRILARLADGAEAQRVPESRRLLEAELRHRLRALAERWTRN